MKANGKQGEGGHDGKVRVYKTAQDSCELERERKQAQGKRGGISGTGN